MEDLSERGFVMEEYFLESTAMSYAPMEAMNSGSTVSGMSSLPREPPIRRVPMSSSRPTSHLSGSVLGCPTAPLADSVY